MINRRDYHICPTCGAALDSGETCDCKVVEKKAERLGLSLRRRYDRALAEDVFELVNRAGSVVCTSNDIMMLSRALDNNGKVVA